MRREDARTVSVFDEILALFSRRGAEAYIGEPLTVKQHSLQTAFFAQQAHATPALIVASLLHDVGHLIEEVPDDIDEWTEDAHHEQLGSRWLAQRFGPEVTEPVRLHVAAKRYLCATRAGYLGKLSSASVHTLALQGGPMSASESTLFEKESHFKDALRVRAWDDRGKIAGLLTPDLIDYRPIVESLPPARR
jgi:[1-hydroxy-2-(trimethylamino)ethyl]phosphonate dioxygenase